MCNDDVGGFEYLVERKILVLMVEGKNFFGGECRYFKKMEM